MKYKMSKILPIILIIIVALSSCGCIEYGKGSSTDTLLWTRI